MGVCLHLLTKWLNVLNRTIDMEFSKLSPEDQQELLHWQYLHGLEMEPVYWNAHRLAMPSGFDLTALVISWYHSTKLN